MPVVVNLYDVLPGHDYEFGILDHLKLNDVDDYHLVLSDHSIRSLEFREEIQFD